MEKITQIYREIPRKRGKILIDAFGAPALRPQSPRSFIRNLFARDFRSALSGFRLRSIRLNAPSQREIRETRRALAGTKFNKEYFVTVHGGAWLPRKKQGGSGVMLDTGFDASVSQPSPSRAIGRESNARALARIRRAEGCLPCTHDSP